MSDIRKKQTLGKQFRRRRARHRIRRRISGTAQRPRLAVHKSLRFIYAQVIDDRSGTTLAQANSREAEIRASLEGGPSSKAAARAVGEAIARRAQESGVEGVVFDRGGYIFHGKIKELAAGARAQGLQF